jgi:hypothetical protein
MPALTVLGHLGGNNMTTNYGRAEWVAKIKDDLSGAVGGIIQAGADLIVARSELGLQGTFSTGSKVDQWVAFLFECGLTKPTASKLMSIARNQVLATVSHWETLPVSWTSLYLLSQVPDDTLTAYLESGEVNTRMTREDVERLIKGTPRKTGKRGQPRRKVKDLEKEVEHLKTELDRAQSINTLEDFDQKVEEKAQTIAEQMVETTDLIENHIQAMEPKALAEVITENHGAGDVQALIGLLTEWVAEQITA